jgi:hypothetical protein
VEYSSFGPARLKPIILKRGLVNDNHLNTGVWQNLEINRSFATTVSKLKISDFSGHTFKGFKVP